jgi:ppGpp synthetase/RelA/SpoT-type nucleotidyltranferase
VVLPISKSALDRLGVRLADGDLVSDDGLVDLERVLDAYQDVVNGVKAKLTELGYSATTRVKTTGTLVEKLRRESARLSQVQDLAGARIVVSDRSVQDEAKEHISSIFKSAGCMVRESDRRTNPSHGYRALHLVVYVEKVPVEIQIRSELQDSWAQIVERLADAWGRGIRYGDDPDDFDSAVRPGSTATRRDVVSLLMRFSEVIAQVEEQQATFRKDAENLESVLMVGERLEVPDTAGGLIIGDTMPPEVASRFESAIQHLQDTNSEVGSPLTGWQQMTFAQFADAIRATVQTARQYRDQREDGLRSLGVSLRDTLATLIDAIGLG